MNRSVVCPICNKEWELRSGFAHLSLSRHMNIEHREVGNEEVRQSA